MPMAQTELDDLDLGSVLTITETTHRAVGLAPR